MSLSIYQFNRLLLSQKFSILEDQAIYLEVSKMEGAFHIALFHLHNFYVEVWLNKETDTLYKANAFTSYKRLDPFITQIDLSAVLPEAIT